jgi:hypothetical protein
MWARSTLAVVAPSGSAAAAAQGRQLLAGGEEEEAVAEQCERQRWDAAGAGGIAGAIACVHMSIKPSEKESRMLVWMLRKNTKVELWKGS